MSQQRLSTTEYAVLGVLAEGSSHGFAVSKELDADSDLGRVFTVRRPLVYRALDRLVAAGYVEPVSTEKGDAGPQRVIHCVTAAGRQRLERWLRDPVDHIRDLRIEFLLKLMLLERRGGSVTGLVRSQREALASTFAALHDADTTDHVELWRRHNAAAAESYLADLEERSRSDDQLPWMSVGDDSV